MKPSVTILLVCLFAGPDLVAYGETTADTGRLHAGDRDPGAVDWIRRGDRLMQKARDTVEHDFGVAEAAYRRALELEPENAEALAGMAWVRNSEHDFTAGKSWAKRALKVNPRLAHPYALLGDGAMELGAYDEALDYFQSALDASTDLSTLSRAASLVWIMGEESRARELMSKAIGMGGPYPENLAWCRAELARMMFLGGDVELAEKQLRMALRLSPENPRVLTMMGRILAARKDYKLAIVFHERSVAVTPMHESMAALVKLHGLTGAKEEQLAWTRRVMRFHRDSHGHDHGTESPHGPGNAQLAKFMADHGLDPADAVHEAEHAYESFPNIGAADALAWCYYKDRRYEEAARMIRFALKWNTPDPSIHFHAGMIHAAGGDRDKARSYLRSALAMNPDFDPVDADQARAMLDRLAAGE